MAILPILYIPDNRLRKIAQPVREVNADILHIVNDMLDTMHAKNGIGLSATQVDIHQRIIVINVPDSSKEQLVLINPNLLEKSGEISIQEGCLSIPQYHAIISRAKRVRVNALNTSGQLFELEADGLLAVCIQHEMDHLVGRLFIDYLSPLKKYRIYKKAKKIHRLYTKV